MGKWVAVGTNTRTIAYSYDAINWTGVTNSTNIFNVGAAVVWNGTIWVAVGQGTTYTIAFSVDGINWTGVPNSSTIFNAYGSGVAWSGSRFVAVGEGTNTIAYSNNGITWTAVANSNTIFTGFGNNILWNSINSRWIATGSGTNSIAYSDDNGLSWTGLGTSIFDNGFGITLKGTRLVAVGNGAFSIAYSDNNGTSWTGVPNSNTIFTITGFGIDSSSTRIIATGSGTNTIAYSVDNGLNWTGVPNSTTSIFSNQGFSIVWNSLSSLWVAVGWGINSIIYSSDDGITWNGNGTNTFNLYGRGVYFNNVPSTAPLPPTNLTAIASDGGTVVLSWNASTGAASYTLQYKVGGFGDWMNLYVGPATSHTVANFESVAVVNNSITYCFQVYATNSDGNSAPSNIAEAMPFNNNLPTRLWSRFEPNCPSFKIEANSIANASYDMQRKSSVLQCPLNGRLNFTKAMLWSMASRNELTRQKAWASQTDSNTYPNITNIGDAVGVGLKQVNNTLTCWNPVSPIICTSTTASNVPGNPAILCFNVEAPFNNYRNPKTYAAGNTKWPMFSTK